MAQITEPTRLARPAAAANPAAGAMGAPVVMSEALSELAARGELRRYRKGTLLIQEGDHGDTIFIMPVSLIAACAGGASMNVKVWAYSSHWENDANPSKAFWLRNISLSISGSRK